MILRRLAVAVAGVALSVGVLSFAVGRIVLSTVGSPEAVASVVDDVTALPEVRTELAAEITTQLADDPLISQFADAVTIRNVVDAVLDGERFDTFTTAASEAAYRVFFEGVPSAEIDLDPLAFEAVERLGVATGVDQLSALAADYGTRLEKQGVLAPGTVDELLASGDRITRARLLRRRAHRAPLGTRHWSLASRTCRR